MKQIEISERKLTEQALKQEEVGRNRKFEEIIEELRNECKAIRQILNEAEQALPTFASSFISKK